MTKKLSGTEASQAWIELIAREVFEIQKKHPKAPPPGLGILQVGENPASSTYIRQKLKVGKTCGFNVKHIQLSKQISESEILKAIENFSRDPFIHGFIVQLPLDHDPDLNPNFTAQALDLIPPNKDADGLSVLNQGRVFAGLSNLNEWSSPIPATPYGIMKLLQHYKIPLKAKDAVVIGKSRLVGLPAAVLLTHAGATVTLCHKNTQNLEEKISKAEILVVAAGSMHLVGPQSVSKSAVIIDVGIHTNPATGRLTGDVHPDASLHCAAISPVPGGVGPMTVAALMDNTFRLYKQSLTTSF